MRVSLKKCCLFVTSVALCAVVFLIAFSMMPKEIERTMIEITPQILMPRTSPCLGLNLSYYTAQIERDLAYWRKRGRITPADLINASTRYAPKRIAFTGSRFEPHIEHFAPIARHLDSKPFQFLLNSWDEPQSLPADQSGVQYGNALSLLPNCECLRKEYGTKDLMWRGEPNSVADLHGFFFHPSTFVAHNSNVPVFSMSRVNCFRDIMYPSHYHLDPLERDNRAWEDKWEALVWRGSSTGGHHSLNHNYEKIHRIRLLEWAKQFAAKHPDRVFKFDPGLTAKDVNLPNDTTTPPPIDIGLSQFVQVDADARKAIDKSYGVKGRMSFSDIFRYKYVLVVDGNTWASRLRNWMKTNSVIFQTKVFIDWWSDNAQPWEHYIPIKFDFSDLEEKLLWAKNNDAKARQIMLNANVLMSHYSDRRHLDCYLQLLFDAYQKLWTEK